ncbi:hypothetical protein HDV06_005938 [Boothiomyces sp. JEL0866]|nr:hypothetical protein HDV06_005938 [Boothiomyces sp. JEL0866]
MHRIRNIRNFRRMSTEAEKVSIVNPLPLVPRLETHYYDTLYDDLMILTYDHSSPQASLEKLEKQKFWKSNLDALDENTFTTPVADLPTKPTTSITSNLATVMYEHIGLPIFPKMIRKKLKNPIDFTPIKKEEFLAPAELPSAPYYTPFPNRIPGLKRIQLKIWAEEAVANKSILLSAIMSLQSITGKRPVPLFAETGDHSKKIRKGMPLGATVEIKGEQMYSFLDKLVQCVLPRIREYEGVNPIGDGKGSLTIKLPASAVGTFPDIEPHFDSFPRLFETDVTFITSGRDDYETCLLLSGFQIPFLPEKKIIEERKVVSDDPWAAIKNAKTREERKALYAEIQKQRQQKK